MTRRLMVFIAAAAFLMMAAACAGQQGVEPSKPAGRPLPTLDLHQPTPTPEFLPPPGNPLPDAGNVQALNTLPRQMALSDASGVICLADFYPPPQPEKAVLLLVSASPKELASWKLLAQTAQVKGLAAMVLELPEPGVTPQSVDAAMQWLAAPENGAFDRVIVAGSGSGSGLAPSQAQPGPEVRGIVRFSAQAGDLAAQAGAGQPVLLVESSEGGAAGAGGSVEVIRAPGAGQGVEGILPQAGVMDEVLNWCLGKLGG